MDEVLFSVRSSTKSVFFMDTRNKLNNCEFTKIVGEKRLHLYDF